MFSVFEAPPSRPSTIINHTRIHMVRAVFNSVLEVIRQLLTGVGFTTVSGCLSSLINK